MSHQPQPVTLAEIVTAANPDLMLNLPPDTSFRWIERNSRVVQPHDLFIAVAGERFDGHDFVAESIARGASAALVRRDRVASLPAGLPLLAVDDPVIALQQIAAQRRRLSGQIVVGITGSLGKSSAKEITSAVLSLKYRTYRSPGNMNSEIGLPLSLLESPPDCQVAVLEMGGAYAPGEVATLAQIARPTIGVVTNIHPIHLERMGSIEAIAATKSELPAALPADGVAILNGDDPLVRKMADGIAAKPIFVGRDPGNYLRAINVVSHGLGGVSFELVDGGQQIPVTTRLVGSHAAELALIAIAVGMELGLDTEQILAGLNEPGVQIRLLPKTGPRNSRLLDDTYNAAAPSVLSALSLLSQLNGQRHIAVLGDMRELGVETENQHRIVGGAVAQVADKLITFGALARIIAEEAETTAVKSGRSLEIVTFGLDERESLTNYLLNDLQSGDTVLLKGSRGLEMETIAAALVAAAPPAGPAE